MEELYRLYPRHVGKGAALLAIRRAIKKVDPELLKNKVMLYSEMTAAKDKQYIPHPATWFNQQRWEDDPEEWGDNMKPAQKNGKPLWLVLKEEREEYRRLSDQFLDASDIERDPKGYERYQQLRRRLEPEWYADEIPA